MNAWGRLRQWDRSLRRANRFRRAVRGMEAVLPESLEVLALVLEAGGDLQVGMGHWIAQAPPGALRNEWESVQRELRLGASRALAWRHLSSRWPGTALQEIALGVAHALEVGAPLAPYLKNQAQTLRSRRALQAEKRAAQAPLWLLLPLFVCILPTIFLVLFGALWSGFAQNREVPCLF